MNLKLINVRNNIRIIAIFLLGLGSMVIGSIGSRWVVGGIRMASLTVIVSEIIGLAILLLAWRDLDKKHVKAFFSLIGEAFVQELTHEHEPITDALLQELLDNPLSLTPDRRIELKQRMVIVSNDPNVSSRERRIAAIMPELMDLSLEVEAAPSSEVRKN